MNTFDRAKSVPNAWQNINRLQLAESRKAPCRLISRRVRGSMLGRELTKKNPALHISRPHASKSVVEFGTFIED